MRHFETATITVAAGSRCQDQARVIEFDDGVVIVVADGAGGTGGGEVASKSVVEQVASEADLALDETGWCSLLTRIDGRIPLGESTCVAFSVSDRGIRGASVGDSQVWNIDGDVIRHLTDRQTRKPLLGSRDSIPVGFSQPDFQGILVASTDGFCQYVRHERLLREYLWHDFVTLPRKLVEMVRLPSGELWDDIGIVICRRNRTTRRRQVYAIDDQDR